MARAILLPVEGKPSVVNLSFGEMQKGVGGSIESIRLGDGTSIYCNEDGIRLGLQPNPHTPQLVLNMKGGAILGDFYVVRHDDGEDVAVTDKDVRRWLHG